MVSTSPFATLDQPEVRPHGLRRAVHRSVANFSLEPCGDVDLSHGGEIHPVLLCADMKGAGRLIFTHLF